MVLTLDRTLQALRRAAAPEDVSALLEAFKTSVGAAHLVWMSLSVDGGCRHFGTNPAGWWKEYQAQARWRLDPVVAACRDRTAPLNWRDLHLDEQAPPEGLTGLGPVGLSVPLHFDDGTMTVLSMASPAANGLAVQQSGLILLAHYLHQTLARVAPDMDHAPTHQALSPRETDALHHLGRGFSRSQVAQVLSISEHTLRAYIESARFKLGCQNTTHAVAKAVAEGLIEIDAPAVVTARTPRAIAGE